MTYLQTHNRPYRSRARVVGYTIAVLVVIIVLLQISTPHFFASIFTSLARPFWRTEFSVLSGSLRSSESLLNQNEGLKRQLTDAQVRLDAIQAIELENTELKSLLGRESFIVESIINPSSTGTSTIYVVPKYSFISKMTSKELESRILSAVLKRPPFLPYDGLIIDIGRDYNLSTSSLIYAVGNVLIGRVVDILPSTAKVKLFSSPGEKYEVLIGAEHIPATAIGRGGGQYEAQISRDTSVKEGDFVINSALNDKPFGIVFMVLSDPTQAFETVLFAPPVNIYQMRWVLVEK
ncbi:MAG: rod shape-determining protein MreC [Patescibacteria group bacterium]